MTEQRMTVQFDLAEIEGIEGFFKRIAHVDLKSVPKRYQKALPAARDLVLKNTVLEAVWKCVPIDAHEKDCVKLSSGHVLSGEMCSRVLKDSEDAFLFVLSLKGFEEIEAPSMLVEFFVDAWASSYVECAQVSMVNAICEPFLRDGRKRTHIWSPGQHDVEFAKNQKMIFDLLEPEDIGCVLTDSLLMRPVKSSSGMFGIAPSDAYLPKPCHHCPCEETCEAECAVCAAL